MLLTVHLAFFVSLLTLPLCAFATTAITKPNSEDSVTMSGTIVDDSGQPAKDATVFIYSARLKKGYATAHRTRHRDTTERFYIRGVHGVARSTLRQQQEW